ncbi:hypothetical protein M5K25_025540 [Dendrobium thyrsiflorum]|uniref:Uncharacterized protein n=1 Tax=Dendrobium thyrsiflorum TaxID=117978 RepID=A0ABD0U4A9_DENTH
MVRLSWSSLLPAPSPLPNPNFSLSTHSPRPNPLLPSSRPNPPLPQALGQPPPSLSTTATNILPPSPCSSMGDPDIDHGFLYDEQERVDILHSPFFDVAVGHDRNANEYVDRILYQLTLAIEDQLPQGHWRIIGHPSTSPDLAPNPATSTRSFFLPTIDAALEEGVEILKILLTKGLTECVNSANAEQKYKHLRVQNLPC